ncbi:MAG TPA: ATP-binding protein [Woeseiaceae bacterium]|nr:ATP-binding protein [Woeseiaceae bacterium]
MRLILVVTIIWFAVAAAVGLLVLREREATVERASRVLSALALALETQTARTFQSVDLTLAGVVDALRLADDLEPDDPEFRAALDRRLSYLGPYVRAIYIVDENGRIIHDTDHSATPAISPGDRPYFQRHRENPALVSSISAPLENHPELGLFVPVTRRIGTDDTFEGIAVAAVQPRYFEALYQRMGLGSAGVISLFYDNGVLISQYPDAGQAFGKSYEDVPLFSTYLPRANAGSYITRSGVLPFEALVSYRAVQSQPLVVAVAQDISAVLAPWRLIVAGAAAALALLLLLLGFLVDQFRRQQQVRERIQERQARTERMEALGHLTSGIAHDFNNLLAVVSSSLVILAHESRTAEACRNAMGAAERAVERGAELIRRLSTFSRSRPMLVRSAHLNECVQDSADLLQRAAGAGVELTIDLTPDLPACLLDETEFEIALVNLVVNARDAMGGQGRIDVRTYASSKRGDRVERGAAERVCVAIEDHGPGMSEQVQQHAFEPYYSTKGDRGTGLGLAQVYGFMLQVGGEARIESGPGGGTNVQLLFRRA